MKKIKIALVIIPLILAVLIGLKLFSHPKPMGPEPKSDLYSMTEEEFWKPQKEYKGELYASDDLTMYPLYASFTKKEQKIYDVILAGIEKGAEEINLPFAVSKESLINIVVAIGYEQEQLFWYDGHSYGFGQDDKIVRVEPCYNELVKDIEGIKGKIQSEVDSLLKEAEQMSPLEAERYFYQYICKNTSYKNGDHDQDIYSVFVQHESVCAGMCNAYRYLLRQIGIPCYYCTGIATDSVTGETDYHGWNIVKLGDGYYNVDITYDDQYGWEGAPIDYVQYEYYHVTDEEIAATHERDELSMTLPACNSDEYSFEQLYGCDWKTACLFQTQPTIQTLVTNLEEYYDACYSIFLQYGLGEHTFTFIVDNKAAKEEIEKSNKNKGNHECLSRVCEYYNYNTKGFTSKGQLKIYYSNEELYYCTQTLSLEKKD